MYNETIPLLWGSSVFFKSSAVEDELCLEVL